MGASAITEVKQTRTRAMDGMKAILDAAEAKNRALTRKEDLRYRELEAQVERLDVEIREAEAREERELRAAAAAIGASPGTGIDPRLTQGWGTPVVADMGGPVGERIALRREERVAHWVQARGGWEPGDVEEMRLGRMIQALVRGGAKGLNDTEQRALSLGVNSAGGFLTPEPLAAQMIDRIRNAARVFQAGATTVPMTVDQLSIARLTSGPNPAVAWKRGRAGLRPANASAIDASASPATTAGEAPRLEPIPVGRDLGFGGEVRPR